MPANPPDQTTPRKRHILASHTLPAWSVIAVSSLALHLILPSAVSHVFAAMILSLIAGVYIGFATMDGRIGRIVVESVVAVLFVGFATWALILAPQLIPLGYLAHAGWDYLHHTPFFNVAMPRWYISACVVYDIIVGLGLWLIWAL